MDTSVLLDVFTADAGHLRGSQDALRKAIQQGRLIICEVVLAELRPCFLKRAALLKALETLKVDFSPITQEAALLAGEAWKKYR